MRIYYVKIKTGYVSMGHAVAVQFVLTLVRHPASPNIYSMQHPAVLEHS